MGRRSNKAGDAFHVDRDSGLRTRVMVLCVLAFTVVPWASTPRGAEVRWSVGVGAGYFTEVSENIGVSPGAEASAFAQLTRWTAVGVILDHAAYRPVIAAQSGSHTRALVAVERHWKTTLLGRRLEPFFQFGLGLGQMEYSDPVRGIQIMSGPTGRLALGTRVELSSRFDVFALVAFDRMDSAINALLRQYPTTLGLTVGATLRLPRGDRSPANATGGARAL